MTSSVQDASSEDLRSRAIRFCNDPDQYFDYSQAKMHALPREELAALHLEGLKYRFEDLKDNIPMLQKLASKQGIEKIDSLDDVVPLLFEHTMYKSYPPVLLQKNRFADINKFLSRLTCIDLSGIDVSGCESIDDWLDVMDKESDIYIALSSGTSGVMSFVPMSRNEWEKRMKLIASAAKEKSAGDDEEFYIIQPYFRQGAGHARGNDYMVKYLLDGDEERFISAYPKPARLSADVLYLTARIRAAKAQGKLDTLEINPTLMARLKEFEELQENMPADMGKFFERILKEFRGKRVHMLGTWSLFHNLAKEGLEKGTEGVFAPNSVITSGGGAKGMTPPANWKEDVCKFIGVDKIQMGYGMTETNPMHYMCEEGHYHFSPAVVVYVLDPETSKPLPRTGRVTGRAAFFDLIAESRWGGFITGDEITVNWSDACPCGQQSYYIEGEIERFSEKQGGDDKISCAATEDAHEEAMDFLTTFE